MTADLPRRVPNAGLPRWCPPPPDGWFSTPGAGLSAADTSVDIGGCPPNSHRRHQEPDLDPARALLRDGELPDAPSECAALLARVLDGIRRISAPATADADHDRMSSESIRSPACPTRGRAVTDGRAGVSDECSTRDRTVENP